MKLHNQTGLTVLWRGSLASCNYACQYCPFAKTHDTRAALRDDQLSLERFVEWATSRPYLVSILFTPWGEALIRSYYREAMIILSQSRNIQTVAIQTNLSCSLDWTEKADLSSLALWTTYHPGETPHNAFLDKIQYLVDARVRHSVGVVGKIDHIVAIKALRKQLPDVTYLWVNAYMPFGSDCKAQEYYDAEQVEELTSIDPYFELNMVDYASYGRTCFTGENVISVDADGSAKRCHFIETPIGNIYQNDFENCLQDRLCSIRTCSCHIGYSHLKDLGIRELFGKGFLERRPEKPPHRDDALKIIQNFSGFNQRLI